MHHLVRGQVRDRATKGRPDEDILGLILFPLLQECGCGGSQLAMLAAVGRGGVDIGALNQSGPWATKRPRVGISFDYDVERSRASDTPSLRWREADEEL